MLHYASSALPTLVTHTVTNGWRAREVARPSLVETVVACPAPGEQTPEFSEMLCSSSPTHYRSYSPPPRKPVVRVGRLTKNVTAAHLDEIFGAYGKILDVDLPINRRRESLLRPEHEAFAVC